MKQKIVLLALGFLIGVGGTFLVSPAIERARESRIVEEAVRKYGLPQLPNGSIVKYAYHKDEFLMEWYGFEIQTTSAQAKIWIAGADERPGDGKSRTHPAEVKCTRRDDTNIEVRIFESHK